MFSLSTKRGNNLIDLISNLSSYNIEHKERTLIKLEFLFTPSIKNKSNLDFSYLLV